MQYRTNPKNSDKISILGFGCMRLPKTAGVISQKRSEELFRAAIDAGINYFDTAYIYAGSETALGRFLAKGYRDKILLATKLPYRACSSAEDAERIFAEQKSRLQTDHIDYYLIHMLADADTWTTCTAQGISAWAEDKKATGEIGNLGFSYHGSADGFRRLLDCYPWDFCQIQLNYADDTSQAGLGGLAYAAAKGVPVIVMEPLRGGTLANLPAPARERLRKERPGMSPAEFSLRWLWNLPGVTCVLSGMNEPEQVEENRRIASDASAGALSEQNLALYSAMKSLLAAATAVPCTGCGYCMPCPSGVEIPVVFAAYNQRVSEGLAPGLQTYISCTALKDRPAGASACVHCGRCERKCPQSLPIREYLDEAHVVMEGRLYRLMVSLLKRHPNLMEWMSRAL